MNAGYAWGQNSVNVVSAVGPYDPTNLLGGSLAGSQSMAQGSTGAFPSNRGGFIGGGQVGYNFQFSSFVMGVETDIQGIGSSSSVGLSTSVTPINGFPLDSTGSLVQVASSIDYLGTVRARLGWLATPGLLIYGTAGLAYGGVKTAASISQFILGPSNGITTAMGTGVSSSQTRVGWTAGGGLEWMFAPNWSAKLEYLYYDLGSATYALGAATSVYTAAPGVFAGATSIASTRFNGHVVRAGLNYHFNFGGAAPVVAKY